MIHIELDYNIPNDASPSDLYLDLMKRCLMDTIYAPVEEYPTRPVYPDNLLIHHTGFPQLSHTSRQYCEVCRFHGNDVPAYAHTMIGLWRLHNIQACVENVIAYGIPGDLCETGVWRGGAAIFMRAVLKAHGVTDRLVWAADSFCGFPEHQSSEFSDELHNPADYSVSLEQVKENFDRYSLLDDQVKFLEGWFKDTLPAAPIDKLAVLRLDGDLYESTMDSLEALYPKLSVGGYLIVDDFKVLQGCNDAVRDYWHKYGISEGLYPIDWAGAYWRKSKP